VAAVADDVVIAVVVAAAVAVGLYLAAQNLKLNFSIKKI
jgi:hypothetical protein